MERAAARTAADMRCRGDDDEGDGVPGLKVEVASAVTALPRRRLASCTGGVSQLAMTTPTSDFACYYCVSVFKQRHQLLEHIAGHFCDASFVRTETLLNYILIGQDRTVYQCLFCDDK